MQLRVCRAAQRRFRERQKCLITDLKSRAESLQKECDLQRHRIAELEKENSVRRARAESGCSRSGCRSACERGSLLALREQRLCLSSHSCKLWG